MKTRSLPSLIIHYLKIGYVFGQDRSSDESASLRLTGWGGLAAWGSGVKIWPFFIWSNKERHVLQYNKKTKTKTKQQKAPKYILMHALLLLGTNTL